jgi:integrase/recombinase XerD
VPLPATMLTSLREFWKTHRHPKAGLSSRGSRLARTGDATFGWSGQAMSISSIQHCFRLARAAAGIKDRGERPHLRHRYATHLLEEE